MPSLTRRDAIAEALIWRRIREGMLGGLQADRERRNLPGSQYDAGPPTDEDIRRDPNGRMFMPPPGPPDGDMRGAPPIGRAPPVIDMDRMLQEQMQRDMRGAPPPSNPPDGDTRGMYYRGRMDDTDLSLYGEGRPPGMPPSSDSFRPRPGQPEILPNVDQYLSPPRGGAPLPVPSEPFRSEGDMPPMPPFEMLQPPIDPDY